MSASGLKVEAPPIPSKYDIIPIHQSDVSNFLRCRRYWQWSSPSKLNLRRRVDVNGVDMAMWFGSGIHYALQMYYDPFLQRDPVEAFRTWYHLQWNGGTVPSKWLEDGQSYDLNPEGPDDNGMFIIRGLQDIHPDPDPDEFQSFLNLGIGMLEYFKQHALQKDNFEIVAAESTFSVPLGFEAIDSREESPNYGELLEVHARGKRDAILYFPDSGRYGIRDYKTAASTDDDYFEKLAMDPQCRTYIWASQEEARIHDLPYKRIDRMLYSVLYKKYPKPPSVLADGISPSVNRKDESATAELFSQYIQENGLQQLYDSTPKWQQYYDWLVTEGDKRFIDTRVLFYNPNMIASQGKHIKAIAKEMLNPDVAIYPTPTGSYVCTRCQFRAPCIAADDGGDYTHLLSIGYEQNVGR